MFENFPNPLIRLGRTFQVLVCTNLLADILGLGKEVVSWPP